MVGSVIPDTLLASLIIIQMGKVGFVPSTLIVTYSRDQSQTLWAILQISFVPYQSQKQTLVFLTSSLTDTSAPRSLAGSGANTQGLTNMLSTAMSVLRKKLIMTGLFFKYLC